MTVVWIILITFAPLIIPLVWVAATFLNREMNVSKHQAQFVQRCTRDLQHQQWEVRRDTVIELTRELTHFRRYQIHALVSLLLKALHDEHWQVRLTAATTLEQQFDAKVLPKQTYSNKPVLTLFPVITPSLKPRIITACLRLIHDPHAGVRKEAVRALGKSHDIRGFKPLLAALGDEHERVRHHAAHAIETMCPHVHAVVFQRRRYVEQPHDRHIIRNPDISHLTIPLTHLTQITIDATTCDHHRVDAFATYGITYLEHTVLKRHVTISIAGNPTQFSADVYTLCHRCKHVDITLDTLVFGAHVSQPYPVHDTGYNVDLSMFPFPMFHVKRVMIETATYDFHLVEHFLTYAVNALGQDYLRKRVAIHLYGHPEKLHPNLRNSLTNLCKRVDVHPEEEIGVSMNPIQ